MSDVAVHPWRGLSFCTGIGGIELGLKRVLGAGYECRLHVEIEAYAAAVLVARMEQGALDKAPIWSNVKTLDPRPWRGAEIITAGYPCQPFSFSGHRRGAADPRHLWPYILHIVDVVRPRILFCENVPGHLSMGFDVVCADLCRLGYAVEAGIFSAAECGAAHERKRLFFLAYTFGEPTGRSGVGLGKKAADLGSQPRATKRSAEEKPQPATAAHDCSANVADPGGHSAPRNGCQLAAPMGEISARRRAEASKDAAAATANVSDACGERSKQVQLQSGCGHTQSQQRNLDHCRARSPQPRVGGTLNGLPSLVDPAGLTWPADWEEGTPRLVDKGYPCWEERLHALGNAVVPAVAAKAFYTLARRAHCIAN